MMLKKHLQWDSLLATNPKIPQIPPLPILVSEPEIATQDPDFWHLEAVMAVPMLVVKLDLPLVQHHLQVRILELVCCKKWQKSPNQETGLENRGCLKVLSVIKLILDD